MPGPDGRTLLKLDQYDREAYLDPDDLEDLLLYGNFHNASVLDVRGAEPFMQRVMGRALVGVPGVDELTCKDYLLQEAFQCTGRCVPEQLRLVLV